MSKRTIYRIIALVVVIMIAGFLFWIGKGHTLLLDHKNITLSGKSYKAAGTIQVTIDKQEPVTLRSTQRKKATNLVAGPWHSIKVEVIGKDKTIEKTIEKKFSVSLDDMFLLNIPALLADDSNWIQVFVIEQPAPQPQEAPQPEETPETGSP